MIFAETNDTNYLMITYTNFDTFKYHFIIYMNKMKLKALNFHKYNFYEVREDLQKFLSTKDFNLNKDFYQSRKWSSFKDSIKIIKSKSPNSITDSISNELRGLARRNFDLTFLSIDVDFGKKNNSYVEYVDKEDKMAEHFYELIGTLLSVYPEHTKDLLAFLNNF